MTDLNSNKMQIDIENSYEIRNSMLHRIIQRNGKTRCLPVVSRAFRWSVINYVHEAKMPLGWQKTLDKVYEQYWFKVSYIYENLHPIPKVEIPWHTVHIDISGDISTKRKI